MNTNDVNTNNSFNNSDNGGMNFASGQVPSGSIQPMQSAPEAGNLVDSTGVVPGQNKVVEPATYSQSSSVYDSSMQSNMTYEQNRVVEPVVSSQPQPVNYQNNISQSMGMAVNQTVIPQSNISESLNSASIQPGNVSTNVSSALHTQQVVNPTISENNTFESASLLNNMSSSQLVENTLNTEINVSNTLENTSEKKKKNPVVIVLIILLLTAIGVALGYFLFQKYGNKGNMVDEDTAITDDLPAVLSSNAINSIDVDGERLSQVLNIVGIASNSAVANNNMLNYVVSNIDYIEKMNDIIVYSSVTVNDSTLVMTYPDGYDKMLDVGACSNTTNCALISKTDAENILKKYNLGSDLEKYFYKSSELDDVYGIHYEELSSMFSGSDTGIVHTVNASLVSEVDINVTDNQVITYIDDGGSLQSDNKSVTYIFKLNEDNNYYLSGVTIN